MVRVSAGVLQNEDGTILICQRPEGKAFAHRWEFPGGKREKGETAQQCLIRELKEELNLNLDESKIRILCSVVNKSKDLTVEFLICSPDHYKPQLLEHQALKWVSKNELSAFQFCGSDQTMLDMTNPEDLFMSI